MSHLERQIADTLEQHGATLVRQKRHNIWRFPDGRIFVQSQTPSDERTAKQQWMTLQKLLNLGDPRRGEEGERRSRPVAQKKDTIERIKQLAEVKTSSTLRDQLRSLTMRR